MSYLYLRGTGKKKEIWIGFPRRIGIKRRKLGISIETVTFRNGKILWPPRVKELQQAIDLEIAKGTFAIKTNRQIPLFSVLVNEFLDVRSGKISPAQVYEYESAKNRIIKSIGDLPIGNYSTLSLGYFQAEELKRNKWNTVAKLFRNLHAIFNYASREFKIENPIIKDLVLKQDLKDPRVYSEEELSKFLEGAYTLNKPFYDQVMYLLLTGMRVSESCEVMFEDLDFNRDLIRYRNIKGKRNDMFPMDLSLKEFLKTLPKTYKPYLFKYRSRFSARDAFDRIAKEVSLPDGLSLHNLKKTFSTLLADTNAPTHITQDLSRHTDIRTTLRYYVFKRLDAKRNALEASRQPIIHLINAHTTHK